MSQSDVGYNYVSFQSSWNTQYWFKLDWFRTFSCVEAFQNILKKQCRCSYSNRMPFDSESDVESENESHNKHCLLESWYKNSKKLLFVVLEKWVENCIQIHYALQYISTCIRNTRSWESMNLKFHHVVYQAHTNSW